MRLVYRRDIGGARMWRMSNTGAVIFIALVVIAVAVSLLLAWR